MTQSIGLIPRPLHSADEIRARENLRFRRAELEATPASVTDEILAAAAARDARGEHYKVVNGFVRDIGRALSSARLAFDAEHRDGIAQALAFAAAHKSLETIEAVLESHDIPVPRAGHITPASRRRRYRDKAFWRRALARAALRRYEDGARASALTHRGASPYLSAATLSVWRERQDKLAAYLDDMEAHELHSGEILPLAGIAGASLANPVNRSRELMLKIRGYEGFAGLIGLSWFFAVVTCPSAYHRTHRDGRPNESWTGRTVRDGQAYHRRAWARVRARAKKRRIAFYGLRTAEPHHDGTPHWNLLLFARPTDLPVLAGMIERAWLKEAPEEAGAAQHRVRIQYADPAKGSAADYVAKYITKGTSGEFLEGDRESDLDDLEVAKRVIAWARVHGIRQFQFVGALRACVWRELRRYVNAAVKADKAVPASGVPELDRCVPSVMAPADYAAFLEAQGYKPGVRDKAACLDYKAARYRAIYTGGRYAIEPLETRWGERRPDFIMGLTGSSSGKRLKTRNDAWRIAHRPTELCKAQAGAPIGGSFGPWTCSTNCNHWIDLQREAREEVNPATGPPLITIRTGIYLDDVEICIMKEADPPIPVRLSDEASLHDLYQAKLAARQAQWKAGECTLEDVDIAREKVDLAKRYQDLNEALARQGLPQHSREQLIYSIETIGTPDPELGW